MANELPASQTGQPLTPLSLFIDRIGEQSRLPLPLTPFVGRRHELENLAGLLEGKTVRLLTVTGAGGVGKTRLALEAARHVSGAFRDGVAFVNLGPVTDPVLVGATIARALGIRDVGAEPPEARLSRVLAQARLLLVLDNFEQVVAAAPLLSELLTQCPELTILVTSRIRLRLSGEREFPVEPLTLPPTGTMEEANRVEPVDAVHLFVDRVWAVRPSFSLDVTSAATVAEIVRRLDGLPLAIELAAVRLKVLQPDDLLDHLELRLPLLTGGGRDLPARQQTMRDTIAWSYDLLDAREQALFRQLAVFVGGFTLAAAAYIVDLEHLEAGLNPAGDSRLTDKMLDGMTTLIDHSLLGLGADSRYLMLEIVREFALEQLRSRGEAEAIQRRHAAYFLEMAETAEPLLQGPEQVEWLDRLERDVANFRAAFEWFLGHDPDQALRLAGALRSFWRIRGRLGEGASMLERALQTGGGEPASRAKALVTLASIRNLQANHEAAANLASEARELSISIGDRRGVAEALRRIAPYYVERALAVDPPDLHAFGLAETMWRDELALRRELEDENGVAWALQNLGFPLMMQGDVARAAELFTQALELHTAGGDQYGMALTHARLGRAGLLLGDLSTAATHYSEALDKFQAMKDPRGAIYVLEDVAWLAARSGQAERAAKLLAAANAPRETEGISLAEASKVHDQRAAATARAKLGDAAFLAASSEGAAFGLERAVAEAFEALNGVLANAVDEDVQLTRRERQVLALLAEGKSDREIGTALGLSPRTVGVHVSNLLGKLGVESRTAAVSVAMRQGLV